ncbi:DUF6207 family protein [Streptomyces sp. NPDC001834]|uniref:DUF6207 family protein n=1 Tax=Streptomyces sp. NPDC001834 TaxID=3364616 RepID=UPI0036AEA5CC
MAPQDLNSVAGAALGKRGDVVSPVRGRPRGSWRNRAAGCSSGPGMEPIPTQHLSEPWLVVPEITAADEATVHAVMNALDQLRAASGTRSARRTPGEHMAGGPGHLTRFGSRDDPSSTPGSR